MENIFIYDNFLNESEMSTLMNLIRPLFHKNKDVNIIESELEIEKQWGYGHSSGFREIIQNKFFSVHNTEEFFIYTMKMKIEEILGQRFTINRHYMHIQTFGLDGSYHTDDNGSNKFTFCLYISDISHEDMEHANGEFLIKLPNKKEIISIDTCMNRGVYFPSEYLHKGMAYNHLHSNLRLCITWKLQIENE
jgi:hypothetical protein